MLVGVHSQDCNSSPEALYAKRPVLRTKCERSEHCGKAQRVKSVLTVLPEENPKQLDQDEIIEILDQAKSPVWHVAMVAANIDIFR